MSLELEDLKKINLNTQFTIFGFIRNAQKLFAYTDDPYYTIPELVMYIILNFYYERIFWDIIAEGFSVSDDGRTLTKSSERQGWNNTSFVNVEIDSMDSCIAKCYIKMDKCVGDHIMIGIIGGRTTTVDGLFDRYDYGYWSSSGQIKNGASYWENYGETFGNNDEICCILDLKKREISFNINGKEQGVACNDFYRGLGFKYRFGISMWYHLSKCSIVKFEKEI